MSGCIWISDQCTMPSRITSTTLIRSAEVMPLRDPRRQFGERPPDEVREDLVLDQHREHRHAQVEQRDEEQGPPDRAPCGRDRRGRVVARQDVRQARGAERQAQQQRRKFRSRGLRSSSLAGKRLVHRHGRLGTGQQIVARLRPRDARRRRIAREIGQFALALADLAQRPLWRRRSASWSARCRRASAWDAGSRSSRVWISAACRRYVSRTCCSSNASRTCASRAATRSISLP